MKPLRILLTADPYIPVPPRFYGGIERVVDSLVRGLHARGHLVTLVAHPASRTPGRLIPYGVPPHFGLTPRATELWQAGSALWAHRSQVDLVHSFGRLAALVHCWRLPGALGRAVRAPGCRAAELAACPGW